MKRAHVVFLTFFCWVATGALVSAEVRSAKVAGEFYPEERVELLDLVTELLKRQPEPAITAKPRILIVPHASYLYSGLIAANGFRQLEGYHYDGVVVVGFTHQTLFKGSSVDTREAYETPLGTVPVDLEAAAVLQTYPGISHLEEAHESAEHSLEVELPFLQVALQHPRIVPVLMGSVTLDDAKRLADGLAGLARLGDYLFVFSTDLSHYHSYNQAQKIDDDTINAILLETPQATQRLFTGGQIEACGRGPILTSLILAAKLGYLKRELLYYANSGDTAGDPRRVVGYAAIGMFERSRSTIETLSPAAGAALVAAARGARWHTPAKQGPPVSGLLERYPELSRPSGIFVTLRKHGQLRGCIGRLQTSESLAKSVPTVALDAALRDSRFEPVTANELGELEVEVSVLTSPKRIANASEIVSGRDGVILELQGHSGVFLPQVWEETGWTRHEFLRELASQKAGLPPDAWESATLSTFQDQVFTERR